MAGVFLTADCLSEEKREGTLGLLFLTDLRGYDVVLGKLMATSVHALYSLLAIFPVLALPLLMGGVTVGEFWRVVLVLLVTLFLSLGIGMLSSAIGRETRQAMGGAFLAILLLAGVLPVCWWLLALISRTSAAVTWGAVLWPSPPYAFRCAFDYCYRTSNGPHQFWLSLLIIGSLGLGCLVLAAVLLPRSLARAPPEGLRPGTSRSHGRLQGAGPGAMAAAARSTAGNRPFLLAGQPEPVGCRAAHAHPGALICPLDCFLLAWVSSPRTQSAFIVSLFLGYGLHQVFKYFAAVEATRQVCEDRRSGALELLLVTPLGEDKIVAGHARAFREQFVPLAVLVGSINLLLVAAFLYNTDPLRTSSTETCIFLELFLGGLVMLGLDLKAIETVGFRSALQAKRHSRAILATLGPVMGVPWAAAFLLVFLMMRRRPRLGRNGDPHLRGLVPGGRDYRCGGPRANLGRLVSRPARVPG